MKSYRYNLFMIHYVSNRIESIKKFIIHIHTHAQMVCISHNEIFSQNQKLFLLLNLEKK